MNQLSLHELHQTLGANFGELSGAEVVADYGDVAAEYAALRESAGVIDLSFRGRICLTGADRVRFLHGQVTNDVKRLRAGEGCYAALVNAKGKMESDLNVWALADELLLDFEPGLTEKVSQRLGKYIVADDVQLVDVMPHYGLLSVQGPKADGVVAALGIFAEVPKNDFAFAKVSDGMLGEIYLMKQERLSSVVIPRAAGEPQNLVSPQQPSSGLRPPSPAPAGEGMPLRGGEGEESGAAGDSGAHGVTRPTRGFDLFVPTDSMGAVADKLIAAAKHVGGRAVGWSAFEIARIEAGVPRFGADMDETNIPIECGIETRAIRYNKGCYIGQEVINRIHTIGHVNRELRALRVATGAQAVPRKGDKLFHDGKEVGYVTSAVKSPALDAIVALGYVRREANAGGTELVLKASAGDIAVKIIGTSSP